MKPDGKHTNELFTSVLLSFRKSLLGLSLPKKTEEKLTQ